MGHLKLEVISPSHLDDKFYDLDIEADLKEEAKKKKAALANPGSPLVGSEECRGVAMSLVAMDVS